MRSLPLSWLDFSLMTKPFMSLLCSLLPPSSSSSSSLPHPSLTASPFFFLFFFLLFMLPLFYFLSFFPSRSCTLFRLSCSFCISFTPPFVFLRLARARIAAIFLPPLSPHLPHSSSSSLRLLHHFLSKHLFPSLSPPPPPSYHFTFLFPMI